ncbi:MAG TPA: glycosyltransferase family 25 protein, partial [Flavisolibacter sp.]|nr:glycosyltransferase family 25 protein [Flavisolibacter sp.]
VEVYEDVIKNNYQKVLILEDDIIINLPAASTFEKAVDSLPADWELLYLGFEGREVPPTGHQIKKAFYHLLRFFKNFPYSHKAISNLYPQRFSDHLYEAGNHDCTHAYGITLSAAKKLVKLQQPISYVADHLLAYACTSEIINSYIILPKIINQQYQVGISSASYLND